MTERLGAIKLGDSQGEPFLGRDMGSSRNYSEDVAAMVDEETKKLLATAHQEAFDILEDNRDVLDDLVLELMEKETLDKEGVARVFEPLKLRDRRPAWTGSPTRNPSSRPPVDIPEKVRRAAAEGAGAGEEEGAVVLTPPGAGGDTHGDPVVDGSVPPAPPGPGPTHRQD